MPISLEEPHTPGHPVVKRQRIGQTFVGALVKGNQRPVKKNGVVQLKDDGKPRQEMVLTLITMPGTDAPAGIGDDTGPALPGDLVRLILRGGGFGEWIEARKTHTNLVVGDIVTSTTTYGQAYNEAGKAIGKRLETQAEVDAVPRQQAVGIYGPITLRPATPAEAEWVTRAEAAYMHERERLSAEVPNGSWGNDQEEPF